MRNTPTIFDWGNRVTVEMRHARAVAKQGRLDNDQRKEASSEALRVARENQAITPEVMLPPRTKTPIRRTPQPISWNPRPYWISARTSAMGLKCPHCDGFCKKKLESTSNGCGCLFLILAALLIFGGVFLGVFVLPAVILIPAGVFAGLCGLVIGSQTAAFWVCRSCRSKIPRAKEIQDHGLGILILIGILIWVIVQLISASPTYSTSGNKAVPPATFSKSKSSNLDQDAGHEFIGLTKQQLIAKMGPPIKTKRDTNAQDGNFEMFVYDDSEKNSTLFIIWENDGHVSSGSFHGKVFVEKR